MIWNGIAYKDQVERYLQVHRFPEEPLAILRGNLLSIQEELGRHVRLMHIPHLDLDRVPAPGARVGHVLGRHHAARVERVEAHLAIALPLGHVDLGRPPLHGRQPKRRPRALCRRRLELGGKVVPAALGHVERLPGVHRAREVVDRDRLAPRRGVGLAGGRYGRQREDAVGDGCVRRGHACAAIAKKEGGREKPLISQVSCFIYMEITYYNKQQKVT